MALLSVIVPTYNRAYCLPRAIDSALAQTHAEIEVVVADDGSTDDTAGMLAERYPGDPRIRYFRQENAGVSAARNLGLRNARGQYIALLDSDDWWQPWKCELQIRCLEAMPGTGMIWTDMEAIGAQGQVVNPRYLKTFYSAYRDLDGPLFPRTRQLESIWASAPAMCNGASVGCGDIFSSMILGNLVHTSTVMLTRERLENVGGFREDLKPSGEDYDFHLRTCREGPVAFVDVAAIHYQIGMEDQLTRPGMGVHIARNFRKTVTSAVERDRARITLAPARIDAVLAEAYAWEGEQLLDAGWRGAVAPLWKSLRYQWRPRTAFCLLGALLPVRLFGTLRAGLRSGKQVLRPLRATAPQKAA